MTFDDLEAVYRKWLDLDADPDLLKLIVSVTVANRIEGQPVWALLIGASGSGKTAVLSSFEKCESVHMVSTLTPASLASGYQMSGVNDSLLFSANGKTLIVKDFSTVMCLPRETRETVFSYLRDAYDGSLQRATGKGQITWKGKIGMIAAATPNLEAKRSQETLLGERFINIRNKIEESEGVIDSVLASATKKPQQKEELSDATAQFLNDVQVPSVGHTLPKQTLELIRKCARVMVKVRASVERDWSTKEIQFPAEVQELSTRVIGQLTLMSLALKYIGISQNRIERLLMRMLHDGVPYIRLRVLRAIKSGLQDTGEISDFSKMSRGSIIRILEEMKHLNIIRYSSKILIQDEILKEALT